MKSGHRVTVWARGAKGVPVSCTCGWKVYTVTVMGAYAKKREHEAAAPNETQRKRTAGVAPGSTLGRSEQPPESTPMGDEK